MKIIFLLISFIVSSGCYFTPKTPVLVNKGTNRSKPVVHIVKYKNEDLKEIVKWHTKNVGNLKAILKYNNKISGYRPKIGDTILIPEEIVKERGSYNHRNVKTRKSGRAIVTPQSSKKEVSKLPDVAPSSRAKEELRNDFISNPKVSHAGESGVSERKNSEGTPHNDKPVLPEHPLVLEQEKALQNESDLDQIRLKYLLELNQK